MGQGEVTLVLGALLLKVGDALGHEVLVRVGGWLLGPALRRDASGNVVAGGRRLSLARRPQPRHQGVADRDDDRPAGGEQSGVQHGQPCPDGQPRAAHIRYPVPTTVWISGGSPSLRRSRASVTETMLLNGSAWASHTCSSSSSALTRAPPAASSISRIPNSLRVRDSGRPARLARCRARST